MQKTFVQSPNINNNANKWKWIQEFKRKGIVEKFDSAADEDASSRNRSWRYPEVTKRINHRILNVNILPKTTAEQKHYTERRQGIVSNLYGALEWALRYSVSDFPVPEWEHIFESQNYRDNEELLCGFAEKIGFSMSKTNHPLLQVKAGAIRQIEQGKVDLQALLAIAIAGAAVKYTDHPFHRLAFKHPGFLDFALQLKKLRDPIEHGDVSDFKADYSSTKQLNEQLIDIIVTLLPSIAPELKFQHSANSVDAGIDVNQERLKAEVQLEKELGPLFYDMLYDIKELLIRSEIMLGRYANNKSAEIVKCFASVMQQTLFEVIIHRKPSEKIQGNIKNTAIRKIVESGFYASSADIPEQIITVNTKRIRRAVLGSSTTLGAHLLAVFLLGSENELIQLKNDDPKFIKFVAELIRLRGHGNQRLHNTSQEDLVSLKSHVFKSIKIVAEVF